MQGLTRLAKIDTEIGGVKIPAGSLIFVMFASGNRDEAQYKDAAGFDLRRENARTHLSFGQGVHFCLGAALARLEGKVAFETLLARLRNIRFAPAGNDFTHTPSFILRGLRALHIEFDRA
ncbi:MAG: cytochrome P450 [Candidatus Binatus sp.]|uniref:cytochrome P450 n=1 Tax=Candidatus Binatus sp. TaxID=2811406 RepID=UPI00271F28D1|nr:cytochrome P450 [Candidatus Binatus sp.]MDO8433128.1 cytochrome P450 [Candidatus Binatus sp.]